MFQFLINFFSKLTGISEEPSNGNNTKYIRTYRNYDEYCYHNFDSKHFNCDSMCPYYFRGCCDYECMDPGRGYFNSIDNHDPYYDYEFNFDIDRDEHD